MLYAKIAVGLAVSGVFDYIVPPGLAARITPGARVWINFGPRRLVGYAVGFSKKSRIKKIKPILEVIDGSAILDKNMLLLTKQLAEYYCCSWGEAIETALPQGLRKGRKIPDFSSDLTGTLDKKSASIELIYDLEPDARWGAYIGLLKENLSRNLSAIILIEDISHLSRVGLIFEEKLGIKPYFLYRNQPNELEEWLKLRSAEAKVVLGTRSAVFAPLPNLGLIIIDNEESFVYKQDQVPHYHAREAAFMRARIEKAKVVLGSSAPSLESFYLAQQQKIKYSVFERKKDFPEIKVIDMRHLPFAERKKKVIFSRLLEDALSSALIEKNKALLFLNRKGFATSCACHNCGKAVKCPRCAVNLVYHYKEGLLRCHYCGFKQEPPKICPECNSGYIKFSGAGTEKIESELARIFPQARLKILGEEDGVREDFDIFIATSSVIKQKSANFGLIGVLGIDNALNHVDFRASEKVFSILSGLLRLTTKKILIQTAYPQHYCFQALLKKEVNLFYAEELRQRRQLGFPPYRHMILLKLRGKKEERAKASAESLFDRLKEANKNKVIEIISVNPFNPPKLRGNYYWQVLVRSGNVLKANKFLKDNLKNFRHSGIIVTVDVDPI